MNRLDRYTQRAQAHFLRLMKELRVVQTERLYRLEAQPPDEYPDASETFRSAGSLVDSATLNRNLRIQMVGEEKYAESLAMRQLQAQIFQAGREAHKSNPIQQLIANG